jgi:cytochrome b subunit of formate dehydrogenase
MNRLDFRIFLFYLMILFGILSLATGILLFLWPHGFRSGRGILAGLNKDQWGTVHTYITVLLIPIFFAHITENRMCVKVYLNQTIKQAMSKTTATA